jgi:hypothetical protein
MWKISIGLLFLVLLFNPTFGQKKVINKDLPEVASFCDVYRNPQKYLNREVQISTYHVQNLMMPAILWGDKCEKANIVVSYDDSDEEDYKKLKRTLQITDVVGKSIYITFIGRLEENPNKGFTPINGVLQDYTMIIRKLIKSRGKFRP